jgi:hypothetical protein
MYIHLESAETFQGLQSVLPPRIHRCGVQNCDHDKFIFYLDLGTVDEMCGQRSELAVCIKCIINSSRG